MKKNDDVWEWDTGQMGYGIAGETNSRIEYRMQLLPSHSLGANEVDGTEKRDGLPSELECKNPGNQKHCPENTTNQRMSDIYA